MKLEIVTEITNFENFEYFEAKTYQGQKNHILLTDIIARQKQHSKW